MPPLLLQFEQGHELRSVVGLAGLLGVGVYTNATITQGRMRGRTGAGLNARGKEHGPSFIDEDELMVEAGFNLHAPILLHGFDNRCHRGAGCSHLTAMPQVATELHSRPSSARAAALPWTNGARPRADFQTAEHSSRSAGQFAKRHRAGCKPETIEGETKGEFHAAAW